MLPSAVIVALAELIGKLIDGQTPEQKAKIWDQWITFWSPVVRLMEPPK